MCNEILTTEKQLDEHAKSHSLGEHYTKVELTFYCIADPEHTRHINWVLNNLFMNWLQFDCHVVHESVKDVNSKLLPPKVLQTFIDDTKEAIEEIGSEVYAKRIIGNDGQ